MTTERRVIGKRSNDKRSSQLGMPHGTATQRLRKLVLFDLLKRHNENTCYRCGNPIKSPDELSMEHKIPWIDKDIALFWYLTNIAFSHEKCNSRAARRWGKEPYPWTDNERYCIDCDKLLPKSEFYFHPDGSSARLCKYHENARRVERARRKASVARVELTSPS